MADSILKLKVESSEYDAKLKKAAEGIRHMADVAHKSGGDLTGLEKAELDYIRALGDMETKSRSASGQVRELSNTYKELTVVYNNLNDVEKADEGGKALAASLETLKQRAQEAKAQLDTATNSLNDNGEAGKGTSSVMEMLKDKFTVNIDAIKLFNVGMQTAEGVLNVAKDAFFNNEEQLDEWGRVVESSHSLYTGFLNALNTGDISGYLSNINQIVQAARDAYDALDNLGTYNAFNQINVERTRTNMTESIADYRGGKGSKDTVKAAGEAYKKELQDRKRLENEAYLAAVKRVAAERGVSAKDLTDALSGTYGHYQDLKKVQPTGVRQTVVGAGMFAHTGTETFAQNRQEKLGEALRHLNDTELQSLQALGAQAQRTGNEIAQVDKQLTRVLNGRQPGAAGGTTTTRTGGSRTPKQSTEDKLLSSFNKINSSIDPESLKWKYEPSVNMWDILRKDHYANLKPEQRMSRADFEEGQSRARENIENAEDPFKYEKKQLAKMDAIAGNIGNITSGLAKMGIELPEGITEMVEGIQTVTGIISSILTLVALVSSVQSVKAIPIIGWALANGGIAGGLGGRRLIHAAGGTVVGNTYSGDQIPAMLNAGEVVLSKAQAGIIASDLQGGGMQNMNLQAVVTGEQLRFILNANSRRRGKGEYITSTHQ